MKELIPKDKYGVFADIHGTARVDSLYVADFFEKEHKNVLRDISKITDSRSGLSEEFARLNFEQSSYINTQNKRQPCYMMTCDGFMILVMGFTGQKAMRIKEAYMNKFNEMEQFISALHTARLECPALTDAILQVHDKPQHYHFSNEFDMINRIVLGMTTKQYKQTHELENVKSIRPYLCLEQIKLIEKLQRTDIGLVLTEPDFQKRKLTLEWYHVKLKEKLSQKQITA